MPTSAEFISLCQSQVALLTQGLGAALSIVYLTEELTASEPQLTPVVAFPEVALHWGEDQILAFLRSRSGLGQRLLTAKADEAAGGVEAGEVKTNETSTASETGALSIDLVNPSRLRFENGLLPQQQMVLPLLYQERVMGLLVTARADRGWSEAEQAQIEHVAQTLTAGCVLDWRAQWLAQDLQNQQLLEERKTDLFDDLLHQFRNPLTALRTFGKLLTKRLRPGDTNHSVAEGIVRESDRLQELLKQLDLAIDLDSHELLPLLSAVPNADANLETRKRELSLQPVQPVQPVAAQPDVSQTRLLLGSVIDLQPHTIQEILLPLLDSAIAIAQERQLELKSDLPTDLPAVLMDTRALREVLNNLIDNALKYTPAGGRILISVQRQAALRQAIVIADTGAGIPAEDLQHLFERHYRGVQAQTNIPGTGLGLSIAKELVQQMQGEIQIFSPAAASGLLPKDFAEAGGTAAVVWLREAEGG